MTTALSLEWRVGRSLDPPQPCVLHVHAPGGHSSGGRALTTKVRGPRFNPGWLPVFHSFLNIFPSLSPCTCVQIREGQEVIILASCEVTCPAHVLGEALGIED